MVGYAQRVRESILPLSLAGSLPAAFAEWRFTEHTIDHEQPVETCQLCGQEELRYHFEIGNEATGYRLWVGSHCILKFDVAVLQDGHRLSPEAAKKRLDRLTQKMQIESCVRALSKLAEAEGSPILANALEYYRRKKKLTPKFAFVVFWKLREHKIDHHPSFFSIELKRHKHIDDLRVMPTDRVHVFWAALTPAQRDRAVSMGHLSPESSAERMQALRRRVAAAGAFASGDA